MGTCIFMKGLKQRRIQHRIGAKGDRVQALLVDEVRRVNNILPFSTWVGALVSAELTVILLCVSLEEEPGPCLITAPLFDCHFPVHFFVPLLLLFGP